MPPTSSKPVAIKRPASYLGGVARNLLAPSFGGYLQPDGGKRGLAFHAGLMVTYIAGLDRLIELRNARRPHRKPPPATQNVAILAKAALAEAAHG